MDLKRILIAAVLFLIWVIISELADKNKISKWHKEDEYYTPVTRLRTMIFAAKAFLDLCRFFIFFYVVGNIGTIQDTVSAEDVLQWTIIFTILFVTVDMGIRFIVNHIRVENGKPDILELYNVTAKSGEKMDELMVNRKET